MKTEPTSRAAVRKLARRDGIEAGNEHVLEESSESFDTSLRGDASLEDCERDLLETLRKSSGYDTWGEYASEAAGYRNIPVQWRRLYWHSYQSAAASVCAWKVKRFEAAT